MSRTGPVRKKKSGREIGRGKAAALRASMTEERWQELTKRLAYHEAGHTVVSYCNGAKRADIIEVSIVPDEHDRGHSTAVTKLADSAADILAGMYAESKVSGGPMELLDQWAAWPEEFLQEWVQARTGPERSDWDMLLELKRERPELVNIKAGLQRVRELLEHPTIWAAVEALAAALLEKKTLTGMQAYSIIAQVTGV